MGEPDGMSESVSARTEGVPTTVLASPNRTSISSRRTPQVSGYTKYTVAGGVSYDELAVTSPGEGAKLTDNETDGAEEGVEQV